MPSGRPLPSLVLSDEQRDKLAQIAQSRNLPHALVVRARTILANADGLVGTEEVRRLMGPQATHSVTREAR